MFDIFGELYRYLGKLKGGIRIGALGEQTKDRIKTKKKKKGFGRVDWKEVI